MLVIILPTSGKVNVNRDKISSMSKIISPCHLYGKDDTCPSEEIVKILKHFVSIQVEKISTVRYNFIQFFAERFKDTESDRDLQDGNGNGNLDGNVDGDATKTATATAHV